MTEKTSPIIDESTEYESLIGEAVVIPDEAPSLLDVMGIDEDELATDTEKHWEGMPAFQQDDNSPYKTVFVHFRNQQDYEDFQKLIGQKLTSKTKSAWHPRLDKTANSVFRWVETDDK